MNIAHNSRPDQEWSEALQTFAHTACVLLVFLGFAAVALAVTGCAGPLAGARAMENGGDLNGAVAAYQQALASNPDDTAALSGAAVDLLALGRYDEALVLEERLVAIDPADAQTRVELGFNYLNHQDRPADAVRVLREAAQLEPSARNLTFLAQAQMAAGDLAGAETTLRQAIDVDRAYAHSYVVLVKLLEDGGRVEEAKQVEEQAALQGITVAAAQ